MCGTCGGAFELSDRNERRYRAEGRAPICSMCRRPAPKPMSAIERERQRRWWIDRFPLDELQALADSIWGAST